MSQSAMVQSIIDRSIGIVTLKDATYEEIEHDKSAISQAAIIVALVGLANGIGALDSSWKGLFSGPIALLIGWIVSSFVIFMIGTRLWPSTDTEADLGQVLRLVGYAALPGLLTVIAFIPIVGWIAALASIILGIIVLIKAIRHALEMTLERAIATAIASWVALLIVVALVSWIFGADLLSAG